MNGKVLSFIVAAIAYGITLTVAALLLPGMRIGFVWGLVAWALFTLSITILRPLLARFSNHVRGYTWVLGIATVLLSLVVTALLSPRSGFRIEGFWTWVWATLIVWVGTLVYDAVDDRAVAAAKPHADRLQAELDRRRGTRPGAPAPGTAAGTPMPDMSAPGTVTPPSGPADPTEPPPFPPASPPPAH